MTFITAPVLCKAGGREQNQDCGDFAQHESFGTTCWVICDGMGGHRGGEVASQLAVTEIIRSFRQKGSFTLKALQKHIYNANEAIIARQESDRMLTSMQTTMVMLLSDGKRVMWAHIGDARLYHFRGGRMLFHTKDHSVPQVMVNAGEIRVDQIRYHEDRNRVLRSLGKKEDLRPTIQGEPVELMAGDVFLLCTDGFWEYVTEIEMEVTLSKSQHPQDWLIRMEQILLKRATGKHDNYSAIALYYG
ncbi:PP2C family protein-serine/threonine phosphatase [Brevibacillus dissolubilis]|uniref:PP2C family protein-serine/threonine phosphatase n=1 Tax=Brevibacillus dissolubilis TaxID=1844116 RepID=UPI001C3F39AA|nr:protein phosphatase 2C domain-containing protein [Brevibacillus dissolubilis]